MSFAERLTLGRDGDPAALEDLFNRWRPLLRLQARKLLGGDLSARVDPSDVVQEAFQQTFESLGQFCGRIEGEWVAWLCRIVAGQAAKTRRHHMADKRDAACDQLLPSSGAADGAPGPESELLDREQAVRLAAAIEELSEPMRDVVLRRVFSQESFDVVARAMNRSPGSARVLWTRAIRCLRDKLGQHS